MKDIIKLGGILLLVTVIAAAALAMVNSVTKPKIDEQKKLVIENALKIALPLAHKDAIVKVDSSEVEYYKGYKTPEKNELVGYAIVAKGQGYSSEIETMVGVDTAGAIIGLTVLHQVETPGLGTKIEEIRYGEEKPWFQVQFLGKTPEDLAVEQDGGNIKAITGATISSRAVTNSIRDALNVLKEHLQKAEEAVKE
ncbi:RnfABCDGE type electron transport complex subunit G [candidate division KSB1 bacterium]|nr:RnfABCDGE type electron transport complex subunit G [candidate division KSB1 bacterium]